MKGLRVQKLFTPPANMLILLGDSYILDMYRYILVQVMELVFQVLPFLYEEEKVKLILTSPRTYEVLHSELLAIQQARASLTDYLYIQAVREQEHRDLLQDLASSSPGRSS